MPMRFQKIANVQANHAVWRVASSARAGGPVGSPAPRRVGVGGAQRLLGLEAALADEGPDDAAEADAAEGEHEDGEEPRVRPIVRQRRANHLHRREHADGGEGEEKGDRAADRAHHAGPVATGVSLRPPHSVHDPS